MNARSVDVSLGHKVRKITTAPFSGNLVISSIAEIIVFTENIRKISLDMLISTYAEIDQSNERAGSAGRRGAASAACADTDH